MIVDGRRIARDLEKDLQAFFKEGGKRSRIDVIALGRDRATASFLNIKKSTAERIGIELFLHVLPEDALEGVVIETVENASVKADGVVLQLPLPAHLSSENILGAIPKELDIDCLRPDALEAVSKNEYRFTPPVARAIDIIREKHNIDFSPLQVALVGHGSLVGKPVAALFDSRHISYEIFTEESDLSRLTDFDCIVSGVGKPHLIKADMVKDGVILFDAGTSEASGVLRGDIDPACFEKAKLATPVPGGIGPITVVALFENLMKTYD